MKDNPPAAADAPELAKFARIGIVAWQGFRCEQDSRRISSKRIPRSASTGSCFSSRSTRQSRTSTAGATRPRPGIYGTDYLMRALVTAIGLGANRPQDAVYPTSQKDGDGKTYNGANKYVMRLCKRSDCRPPVGFWSVTMYNSRLFLRSQSDQPVLNQRAAESEVQSGWFDRSLHPEGLAGCRQGSKLASGSIRKIPS